MAYSQQEGKDRSIFVTREDHETPRNAELAADDPNDPYEEHGRMLPHGDNISWNCPCLGGMARGPRGEQFKVGFSCFHCSRGCQGVGLCRPTPRRSTCRSTRTSIPRKKRRSQRID